MLSFHLSYWRYQVQCTSLSVNALVKDSITNFQGQGHRRTGQNSHTNITVNGILPSSIVLQSWDSRNQCNYSNKMVKVMKSRSRSYHLSTREIRIVYISTVHYVFNSYFITIRRTIIIITINNSKTFNNNYVSSDHSTSKNLCNITVFLESIYIAVLVLILPNHLQIYKTCDLSGTK